MILLMQCVNEENAVSRVLSDIHDTEFISRVIVIDGGSTDYTVQELKKFGKVEVFEHPWLDWYHDMNVCQRNIGLSYIPHGQICFILDFDEKCTDGLKEELARIDREGMGVDLINVPRRTYELMRYPNSPYAMIGEDGWPIISHQIGQYPDFQPRIIKRNPYLHWINSPHHVLAGKTSEDFLQADQGIDIIHYEKDDARDRIRIERKWAREQATRKKLGLIVDVFETKQKSEVGKYYSPEAWEK